MTIFDDDIEALTGGSALLVVNVASRCGMTPPYPDRDPAVAPESCLHH